MIEKIQAVLLLIITINNVFKNSYDVLSPEIVQSAFASFTRPNSRFYSFHVEQMRARINHARCKRNINPYISGGNVDATYHELLVIFKQI